MSEIKKSKKKYISNLIEEFESNNVSTHSAGFKDGDIVKLPIDGLIECRIKEFKNVKYGEFSMRVNGTEQFKSLGSLYRDYKLNETDEISIFPNGVTCLKDTLEKYCGKTIKLHKVFGAIRSKFNEPGYENVTVFEVEIIEQ